MTHVTTILVCIKGFNTRLCVYVSAGHLSNTDQRFLHQAHICLLPTLYGSEEKYEACRIVSILTNFFFLACFM